MKKELTAAIGCRIGKVRTNNEDNFYFDGKTLKEVNHGLSKTKSKKFYVDGAFFGIFDGMGGEACGETASYLAAGEVRACLKRGRKEELPAQDMLKAMCLQMNETVCRRMQSERSRMGSTAATVYFDREKVYVCNLGDSRVFRLRSEELEQLSEDHTDEKINLSLGIRRKPRLTQHLGIFPEELTLEPFIKEYEMRKGDRYLLCSDGLTDMLTEDEICTIMTQGEDVGRCVDKLMDKAMEHGGKDNTTIIVCEV